MQKILCDAIFKFVIIYISGIIIPLQISFGYYMIRKRVLFIFVVAADHFLFERLKGIIHIFFFGLLHRENPHFGQQEFQQYQFLIRKGSKLQNLKSKNRSRFIDYLYSVIKTLEIFRFRSI